MQEVQVEDSLRPWTCPSWCGGSWLTCWPLMWCPSSRFSKETTHELITKIGDTPPMNKMHSLSPGHLGTSNRRWRLCWPSWPSLTIWPLRSHTCARPWFLDTRFCANGANFRKIFVYSEIRDEKNSKTNLDYIFYRRRNKFMKLYSWPEHALHTTSLSLFCSTPRDYFSRKDKKAYKGNS